jgi:hypothetical protein
LNPQIRSRSNTSALSNTRYLSAGGYKSLMH